MRIILIIIGVIIAFFVSTFIFWYIYAAVTDKKRTKRYTDYIFSVLPKSTVKNLSIILKEYKVGNVEKINELATEIPEQSFNEIVNLLDPQRKPKEFSTGKFGDRVAWEAWLSKLEKKGYNEKASQIIAICYLNYLQEALLEYEVDDILKS